jgi:hypothetical protein
MIGKIKMNQLYLSNIYQIENNKLSPGGNCGYNFGAYCAHNTVSSKSFDSAIIKV